MSEREEKKQRPPSEDEARARDLLQRLPDPTPDPAFHARLRREFTTGEITSPLPLSPARPGRAATVAVAATIAMLLLSAALQFLNRPPAWMVIGHTGTGTVLLDGREIPVLDLAREIRSGRRVEARGELQLDLHLPGTVVIQLPPGGDVTLAAAGRWFDRTLRGEIRAGEVRCVTGPRLHGSRLILSAPDATIEVSGTTFAVICEPDATCLCVFDGSATMVSADGKAERVAPGTRRTVYRSGAPPLLEEIRPMERMKLEMLADQSRSLLENHQR